jgi:CheY-like chemotaxis protein
MPRSIWLVEDASNDIELVLFALRKCGVENEIIVARDGEEALDYLLCKDKYLSRKSGDPWLILFDLKLPFIDGIAVLKTITSAINKVPLGRGELN